MKIVLKVLLIVLMFYGCSKSKTQINEFSTSTDTLIIKTKKRKGTGLFMSSSFPLRFQDTTEKFDYPIIYPIGIIDIKRCQKPVYSFDSILYSIDIIKGKKDGKDIFIVDQNSNRNLSDDSLRLSKQIKWYSSEDVFKCNYSIYHENQEINDYSWIQLRKVGNGLWMSRKDYISGSFSIDHESYEIGVIDIRNTSFSYNVHPEIALISDRNSKKDTLLSKEVLKLNEYLKLNKEYYRFAEISRLGDKITLVKEKDFKNKVGTQLGMLAPSFNAVSINGDVINSNNLKDKITIIANACGCGGDVVSFQTVYDINNIYSNRINVLGLDSKIDKNNEGFYIDVAEEFNKDIYEKYRNQYCSRVCYVIGKNNRIIDKFEISDWESNLSKLLN